jgi:hypothetical protein
MMAMVRAVTNRWVALGVVLLMAIGLLLGPIERIAAQEPTGWEALGPEAESIGRLYTPASGTLLAQAEKQLLRSDDGGVTWFTITLPADTDVFNVSPQDHQLLYAAGSGGVYRSEDGGGTWTRASVLADRWIRLEASPADPNVLYGVVLMSPPAEYGKNFWHDFRVSHDAGATWETVRIFKERILPGTRPCFYSVNTILPHAVNTVRVLTIEGCNDRGMNPASQISLDEGRTTSPFPPLGGPVYWAADEAVGGRGVNPDRWYVSIFKPGIVYSRIRHSKLMRSDDGETWTTVFEDHGGEPDKQTGRPMDFISQLAYNPNRPDDVFAVFRRYEPSQERLKGHDVVGFSVRMSRDGGLTWQDLGAPDPQSVNDLAVGVDARYLYAATAKGVYRIALPQ